MTSPTSDFTFDSKRCELCGAVWLNGKHHWYGGKTTANSELDLAGLCCNIQPGDVSKCINPQRGEHGGDTWEKRLKVLEDWERDYYGDNLPDWSFGSS